MPKPPVPASRFSKFPLLTCSMPPASQNEHTAAGSVWGPRVGVQSGLHVRCKSSTHSSNPYRIDQTCLHTLCHFFLSPSLMPTSLWLVTEPQQSLSGWGLAGIKQLNAWADYFRDSLPPVPTDNCHWVWGLSWAHRRSTGERMPSQANLNEQTQLGVQTGRTNRY